jgi:hypothetical protein
MPAQATPANPTDVRVSRAVSIGSSLPASSHTNTGGTHLTARACGISFPAHSPEGRVKYVDGGYV